MATVKLVDENNPHPVVQEVFRDIKEAKKIDFVPHADCLYSQQSCGLLPFRSLHSRASRRTFLSYTFATFHRQMSPSAPPEASSPPEGAKATQATGPAWPSP
jgi:hypothetical protein